MSVPLEVESFDKLHLQTQ